MKRRNLCKTRKLLAVIIAASMSMNSGMIAMADQEVSLGSVVVDNNNENNDNNNVLRLPTLKVGFVP